MKETENCALKLTIFYLGTSFCGLLLISSGAIDFLCLVYFYPCNKVCKKYLGCQIFALYFYLAFGLPQKKG